MICNHDFSETNVLTSPQKPQNRAQSISVGPLLYVSGDVGWSWPSIGPTEDLKTPQTIAPLEFVRVLHATIATASNMSSTQLRAPAHIRFLLEDKLSFPNSPAL